MTTESMKKYNTYGANIGAVAATQPITPAAVTSGGGSVVPTYADYLSGKGTVAANAAPVSASYAGNVAAAEADVPTEGNGAAAVQPAAPATEPVDTYEQWLIKNAETYKDVYDRTVESIDANKQAAIDAAEQQRVRAEQNAETERQRANIDARSSYAMNLATYGRKAEQLLDMGLTGSGYSEYLNSQAYAQMRAEQQGANAAAEAAKRDAQYVKDQTAIAAEQQANSDKLSASLSYEQNLNKNAGELAKYQQERADAAAAKAEAQEATRKEAYANLLTAANNGDYSADQIRALAGKYGLSESDITSLVDAADAKRQKTYAEGYAAAIDAINEYGGELDTGYIDNLLELDYITEDQATSLKAKYDNKVKAETKEQLQAGIESGDSATVQATLENADTLYKDGKITKDEYQDLYGAKARDSVDGVIAHYTDSAVSEMNGALKDMYESGKISATTYNDLVYKLNKDHYYVQGLGTGRKNDDIDVTIGSTSRKKGDEYDLLCGDKVTDESLKSELNKLASKGGTDTAPENFGKIVVYNDNMYIYTKKQGWATVISDHSDVKDAIKAYKKMTTGTAATSNGTTRSGGVVQNSNPVGSSSYVAMQKLINEQNLREGDRGRWGQALKYMTLSDGRNALTVWQSLTDDERSKIKGTLDK